MSRPPGAMPWVFRPGLTGVEWLRQSEHNNVLKGPEWEALLVGSLTPDQLQRREAIIAFHLSHDRHLTRKEARAIG